VNIGVKQHSFSLITCTIGLTFILNYLIIEEKSGKHVRIYGEIRFFFSAVPILIFTGWVKG